MLVQWKKKIGAMHKRETREQQQKKNSKDNNEKKIKIYMIRPKHARGAANRQQKIKENPNQAFYLMLLHSAAYAVCPNGPTVYISYSILHVTNFAILAIRYPLRYVWCASAMLSI